MFNQVKYSIQSTTSPGNSSCTTHFQNYLNNSTFLEDQKYLHMYSTMEFCSVKFQESILLVGNNQLQLEIMKGMIMVNNIK